MSWLRVVRQLVREQLLDAFREKGFFRSLLLVPLLGWLVVGVLPVFLANQGNNSDADLHASLAVPLDTPVPIVHALGQHLRVVRAKDPESSLTNSDADAAMEFAPGTAAALRSAATINVRAVTSDRTKGALTAGVAEGELKAMLAQRAGLHVVQQRITGVVSPDPDQTRGLLANAAPMLYVFALGSIAAMTASLFQAGRGIRSLEMLLLRPYPRSALLAGLAASAATIGLLGAAIVLIPLNLAALAVSASHAPVVATAATLTAVVFALALMFAALGLAVGTGAESARATTWRTTATVGVIMLTALAMEISRSVADKPILRWLPFTSALVLVRNTIVHGPGLVEAVRALALTVAFGALCLAYARRYLDSERVTTRA